MSVEQETANGKTEAPVVSDAARALRNAADQMIAHIIQVEIDPRRLIGAALERNSRRAYPSDLRYRQALVVIEAFAVEARELLETGDLRGLRHRIWALDSSCLGLALGPLPPEPTWDQDIQRWCRDGWTQQDFDLDRWWCFLDPPGRGSADRIASITENSVTLKSGRVVTRAQLGLAPLAPKPPMLIVNGPAAMLGRPIS